MAKLVGYAEAVNQSHKMPKGKPVLDHLRIEKAEEGHIVEHHFESSHGPYVEPEKHVFGKSEGKAMLAHVAEHMGIKAEAKAEGESPEHEAAE